MKAYVTGALHGGERAAVEAHLRTCSVCSTRMLDEGAPQLEEELFPKRLRNITMAAVGVLLAVVVGSTVWWMQSSLRSTSAPAAGDGPDVITLRDGNGALTFARDGKVESTFRIPTEYHRPLSDMLRTRRLRVPQVIAGLAKGYSLTEKRKPGDFRYLSPIGTAVSTDTPVLRWESVADAASYTVTISRDGATLLTSPPLFDTQWETPQLSRGALYEWNVAASRGSDRVQAARMSGGNAAFLVLQEDSARRLADLARENPNSHLLLGVAFGGAGAIERAEEELRVVVHNNPQIYFLKEIVANLRPGVDTAP